MDEGGANKAGRAVWRCHCRSGGAGLAARSGGTRLLVLAAGFGLCLVPPVGAAPGLTILTHETNDTVAEDLVVMRLEGSIAAPMAEAFVDGWAKWGPGHNRLVIDLDSPGGELAETEAIVAAIARIRETAIVDTLVRHDAICASACIAIFMQGATRLAGGSSTWLFHGACHERSNRPDLALTDRYLDILREAGVAADFLCLLVGRGYVTTPGKLWVSGYELVHVFDANIITQLLEPWRPERGRVSRPGIEPH